VWKTASGSASPPPVGRDPTRPASRRPHTHKGSHGRGPLCCCSFLPISQYSVEVSVFYLFIHANTESALLPTRAPTRMTMSRVPERAAAGGTAPPGSPQFVRRRTQVPPLAVSV